jgi:hypothetical protein
MAPINAFPALSSCARSNWQQRAASSVRAGKYPRKQKGRREAGLSSRKSALEISA